MEYSMFIQRVCEAVKAELSEDYDVFLSENIKNNGVSLWAVNIKESEEKAAPVIYLEEYYEKYKTDIYDIKTIAKEVIDCYFKHKDDIEFDIDIFKDFAKVKNNIRCRLINREENFAFLRGVPYEEFLDLAIVFYCIFNETSTYTQSFVITNAHLELWKINFEVIKTVALENTKKYSYFNISAMSRLLHELFRKQLFEGELIGDDEILEYMQSEIKDNGMYVLTNRQKLFGAVGIIYGDVLRRFADIVEKDLYIIPSSIHEVIIMPYVKESDINEINRIIEEVNMNNVQEEERLSGHVYMYKRKINQVVIPASYNASDGN